MRKKKKVLIIGGGPAGLSCAYELTKRDDIEVELFEASDHVGGMSRSIDLWGQVVDLGPHRFFSKDREVNSFFHEIIKEDCLLINRLTRICYRNRYFHYPLRVRNILQNLSPVIIIRVLWDYLTIRLKPITNPETFEDWIINKFGKKLFNIFFRSYSEKLWGISCREIDAEWASQRIKTLSLKEAILSAFFKRHNKKHKTLVDQFYYPTKGTGQLYENVLS